MDAIEKVIVRTNRVYRRTDLGAKALQSERSIPSWFRSILDAVSGETHFNAICETMGSHSRRQVLEWLDQLETLGFVDLVAFTLSAPGPDTTGTFSFHAMRMQGRAA